MVDNDIFEENCLGEEMWELIPTQLELDKSKKLYVDRVLKNSRWNWNQEWEK